jgi:predicted dehydrogenase
LVQSSALHDVYAAQLGFHNAYGPDKAWVYDTRLLGGGALVDLGAHLVDLALWTLDFPNVLQVNSRLFAEGRPVSRKQRRAEDYVVADLTTDTGAVIHLSCSWRLHVGQDCSMEASFFGTRGGARFHNLGGSFYDFGAELLSGTTRRTLCAPPDNWQGRAAIRWMQQLARDDRFDLASLKLLDVANVIDRIYDSDS